MRAGAAGLHYVPEASRDVYDIAVADELVLTPVAYIFVIDVNGTSAYLDAARVALRKALDVIDGDTLVGVLLYGDAVSFVDARGTGLLRRFSPLDTEVSPLDVFSSDQWLRPSGPALTDTLMPILGQLTAVDPTKDVLHAAGPAIRAALDMVEAAELTAARIVVIAAGEPNFGDGSLEGLTPASTDNDHFALPACTYYADQGSRAAFLGAMVDVYVVCNTKFDVPTISPLAQVSGGRLVLYEEASSMLAQDVWQHLNDPAVLRGLLRLRTSSSFTVSDVYGCGMYRDAEVQDVFRLSCHGHSSTLAAELALTDANGFARRRGGGVDDVACIQTALRGVFVEPGALPQRVLRVETHLIEVCDRPDDVRESADANAIATVMFHKAVAMADEQGIAKARALLFNFLANLTARTYADGHETVDQGFSDCAAIGTVPRLMFGLTRSFLFREEVVAADLRAGLRCIWEDLSAELLAAAAYPQLMCFRTLDERSEKDVALSSEAVKACGDAILMLDAFSEVIIYYTASAGREVAFPPPESSLVMRVRAACIRDRPLTPKVIVCREGTPKDRWFKSLLIEDAAPGAETQCFSSFMETVVEAATDILDQAADAQQQQ